MLRQLDKLVNPGLWSFVLAAGLVASLAACAGGLLPVFDSPREIAGSILMMPPEVRLADEGREGGGILVEAVEMSVRQALAGRGLSVVESPGVDAMALFRRAVESAWSRQRALGGRRFKAGEDLGLRQLLELPAGTGARSAAFVVLSRAGGKTRKGYAPIPMDEIILLPEERPDYVVPRAGGQGISQGIDMDLLILDLYTSEVILHRRVSHPARSTGEIIDAISILSRELTRGIRTP